MKYVLIYMLGTFPTFAEVGRGIHLPPTFATSAATFETHDACKQAGEELRRVRRTTITGGRCRSNIPACLLVSVQNGSNTIRRRPCLRVGHDRHLVGLARRHAMVLGLPDRHAGRGQRCRGLRAKLDRTDCVGIQPDPFCFGVESRRL